MKNVNKFLLLFILVLLILTTSCDTTDATTDANKYTVDINTFDGDICQFRDPDTGIYYLIVRTGNDGLSVVPKLDYGRDNIKLYKD